MSGSQGAFMVGLGCGLAICIVFIMQLIFARKKAHKRLLARNQELVNDNWYLDKYCTLLKSHMHPKQREVFENSKELRKNFDQYVEMNKAINYED